MNYGLFGMPQSAAMLPQATRGMWSKQDDEEQKKRWMDGGKFTGKDFAALALGAIGDAFSGRPNTAQFLMHNIAQKKAQEQALAAEQRAMANQKELYGWKKQTDLKYPDPVKPPTIAQETAWLNSLPPAQRQKAIEAIDVLRPVMTTTWQGPQVLPRSGLGGGGNGIPVEAIQELRASPQTAAQFDEIFGAGAAASILGQ